MSKQICIFTIIGSALQVQHVFHFQMRNNKKTAILVKEVNAKKRLFLVYRPNTGRQLKLETYADIKKKFKKVTQLSFTERDMRRTFNDLHGES